MGAGIKDFMSDLPIVNQPDSATVSEPAPATVIGSHPHWKEPLRTERIPITCQLLPTGQVILFTSVLLILSCLSWLFFGGKLGLLTGILPLFILPLIIGASTRLRISLDNGGFIAENGFHREMLYERGIRPWSDLHSVRLRKMQGTEFLLQRLGYGDKHRLVKPTRWQKFKRFLGEGWMHQGFIVFDFKSGGIVAFPLAGFNTQNLEKLFLTVAKYADPIVLNPDVIALQRDILTGGQLQLSESYTRMWEASLAERFEVTNFVPLEAGASLLGNKLTVMMLLTCGGMSSVYLVRDAEGRRLILKEMAAPFEEESQSLAKIKEMFLREAALLGRLKHPGIVSVLDSFVERQRNYLLLEFVPGLTLRQHVKMTGVFSERETLDIAMQIADILVYLHGLNPAVIHRDLTPDNLIISEEERKITLVDFGAANEFIGALTGTLIGKQCYIPPEQFQGRSVPASDLYALGCTIYYILTGLDPEPISQSSPTGCNTALSKLVELLTSQDLHCRPKTAKEVLLSLSTLKAG